MTALCVAVTSFSGSVTFSHCPESGILSESVAVGIALHLRLRSPSIPIGSAVHVSGVLFPQCSRASLCD